MRRRVTTGAMFIWDFIVGDDWRIAAAVVVGLVLTAVLHHAAVTAWWLLPVLVPVILAVSVRSMRRTD